MLHQKCASLRSAQGLEVNKTCAMLLQKAVDSGFDGSFNSSGKVQAGKVFYELASAHLRVYLTSGLKAERIHLKMSVQAWKKALTYMENSVRVGAWLQCAMAHQYLGEYKEAGIALGQIIVNFPRFQGVEKVLFRRVMLLKRLKKFGEGKLLLSDLLMRTISGGYAKKGE